METKVYLRVDEERGFKLVPYEDYRWTGRWKIETIKTPKDFPPGYVNPEECFEVTTTLTVERQVGIFPWWKCWEDYDDFVFREEECFINECEVI